MGQARALTDPEQELIEAMASFDRDPLGWVLFSFEWGQGELEHHRGPNEWQAEVLKSIRDGLSLDKALRIAVASGHGVGKSCLASWIILWAMSTCVDTRGVVTANTAIQLQTKTWAELSKWHRLAIFSHWFAVSSTAIFSVDPAHHRSWRVDCVPWNETRTEAFAGLHNQGKRILVMYDEASAIPDVIWEVSEGALTDSATEILWTCFGNPTRNIGRFRECFAGGRFAARWNTKQVDSRTVPGTNKQEIDEWSASYGEDSDFFRVRVRGIFPRAGSMQFIPGDVVEAAASLERDPPVTLQDPFVMGVDVARFGDDKSVICFRRGRDALSLPLLKYRGIDTMQLAAKVAELYFMHKPDAVFVDGGGVGGGVVDRLRALHIPVIDVQFGAKADRDQIGQSGAIVYANKRAEMWGTMRDWLEHGVIPDDADLKAALTAVEYGYTMQQGRDCIILEKKEHMKKRHLESPDEADALALTFAYPIGFSDHSSVIVSKTRHEVDYDPYSREA